MNEHGHNRTDAYAQQGIAGEVTDKVHEAGIIAQGQHGFAHHIHAQH